MMAPMSTSRVALAWHSHDPSLRAIEPDEALVRRHASTLAGWYNASENATMMGAGAVMSEDDVIDFWRELRQGGARGFLCFSGEALVGDMDLRGELARGHAEFAIMIGETREKGRGLGLAFATMIHVFAFRDLGLGRIYVTPKTENERVQRLNRRLGYVRDDGPLARSFLEPGDDESESQSIGEAELRSALPAAWTEVDRRPAATAHDAE